MERFLFIYLLGMCVRSAGSMKKIIYILSIFTAFLLFNSCEKAEINKCGEFDPFAPTTQEDGLTRGHFGGNGGGILDTDEDDDDLDEDNQIVDPDEDDDDMDDDDDDNTTNDNREGGKGGGGV